MSETGNYVLLPVYLVLDTSASMTGEPFKAAFNFIPRLISAMNKSTAVADRVRLGVITFDQTARVVATLSGKKELEDWYKINKNIRTDGVSTIFSKVFELIKTEVAKGVENIRSQKIGGVYYKSFRPAVFFITDGDPVNDSEVAINEAYTELTSLVDEDGRDIRPNIFMIGVGAATKEKLEKYGASRYKHIEYTVHNANAVLVRTIKDGLEFTPEAVLDSVIPKLISSIISSTNTAGIANNSDDPDLQDPLGEADNLFDADDDESFVFDDDDGFGFDDLED